MDWKKLSTTKITQVYKSIFLNQCYLCQTHCQSTICKTCHEGFPLNLTHCLHCKRPTHLPNILCGHCQANLPTYQLCLAPYRFEGIIKTLIHSIKFNQGTHFIRPLTELLSAHLIDSYSTQSWPEQILYVPSHPNRIKERGFCQTQAITTQLAKNLRQHLGEQCPSLPKTNPLKKVKNTHAQHSLARKERLKSPQNSYLINGAIAEHVALFDDIMTTGSTIEHCVKLLLKAGAKRVDIWLIARTPDK